MEQVSVHARSSKDTDRSVEVLRWMPCILQSFPGALKKVTVLRIHDGRVSRTQSEKGCIEHRNIVEQRGPFDIVGVSQFFRRCAGSDEVGVGAIADGLHAIAQVLPKLGNVVGSGKTARHANDRDTGGGVYRMPFSAVGLTWRAVHDPKAGPPQRPAVFLQDGRRACSPWKTGTDRRERSRAPAPVAAWHAPQRP